MAFYNRMGNIIMRSTPKCSMANGAAPMINFFRCMSSSKLFVGGLSYGTDDQSLRDAFSSFGDVTEARIITDRDTGRSRGFGFVTFDSNDSASSALSGMDGQELNGRNIRVSYANDRPSGGGFRGGYGGGSGYGGRSNDFGGDSGGGY